MSLYGVVVFTSVYFYSFIYSFFFFFCDCYDQKMLDFAAGFLQNLERNLRSRTCNYVQKISSISSLHKGSATPPNTHDISEVANTDLGKHLEMQKVKILLNYKLVKSSLLNRQFWAHRRYSISISMFVYFVGSCLRPFRQRMEGNVPGIVGGLESVSYGTTKRVH